MNTVAMLQANQAADLAWTLAPRSAVTLHAEQPQWLWVHEGRVWLTRGDGRHDGDDVWLEPGQRHLLPAGSHWVAEGWPAARVSLVLVPRWAEGASLRASSAPLPGQRVLPAAQGVPRAA